MPRRAIDRRALLTGAWRRTEALAAEVRPPGAGQVERFAALCDGCGDCAQACPAGAIQMTGPALASGAASPRIVAEDAACVMCDGLVCSAACPTGALEPVSVDTMAIATASFRDDACWARNGLDLDCDYCFDRCPRKGEAITYRRGRGPRIHAEACSGCGTCVFFCPSRPKALTLVPT